MTYEDRVRMIVDQVRGRDAQFGRSMTTTVTASSTERAARRISDDPRWTATIVPSQLPAAVTDGADASDRKPDWDLFQLWVYDDLKVTAHLRGDELGLRMYKPGPWEKIFLLFDLPGAVALLPGGHPRARMPGNSAQH